MTPQAPQLLSSVCVSTHDPAQFVFGLVHAVVHAPLSQT
jgi:hypothetical protein